MNELEFAIENSNVLMPMSNAIIFTVFGRACAQGSKRHVGNGRMVESNPNLKPWRGAVAHEAAKAMNGAALLQGPVEMTAQFYFARPKSHYRTGKQAGVLKQNAPGYFTSAPDLDKLLRAVGDAMSGIVFHDDRQLCGVNACKEYTSEQERVVIVIREVD